MLSLVFRRGEEGADPVLISAQGVSGIFHHFKWNRVYHGK
jgi:hypothetical protein